MGSLVLDNLGLDALFSYDDLLSLPVDMPPCRTMAVVLIWPKPSLLSLPVDMPPCRGRFIGLPVPLYRFACSVGAA